MFTRTRAARALAAAAALTLLAAACGDDDDDAATDTTASTEATDAPTGDEGSDGADDTLPDTEGGEASIEVTDSALGQILTSDGRTLYAFVPDDAGPSTCTGGCADTWPALLTDGAPSGEGLAAELGTAEREDGGEQVTIAGWPLYFFAGDNAAGDTNGQGVNDVWYVVGPDGEMIQS